MASAPLTSKLHMIAHRSIVVVVGLIVDSKIPASSHVQQQVSAQHYSNNTPQASKWAAERRVEKKSYFDMIKHIKMEKRSQQ